MAHASYWHRTPSLVCIELGEARADYVPDVKEPKTRRQYVRCSRCGG